MIVEIIDPVFEQYVDRDAELDVLHAGQTFIEGPVWFAQDRLLLFSDIPQDKILRWRESGGEVDVYRAPSGFANGNSLDLQGRLLTCEHGERRLTRTEHDGTLTVIADRFDGKRFDSPNDVVAKSDGSVWFTDPPYGIIVEGFGTLADSEIGSCNVYRVDPIDGRVDMMATGFDMPNGLAFSADESLLYVADSGRSHGADRPHNIRVYAVEADGTLSGGDILIEVEPGYPDGIRLDIHGNLWVGVNDGVHCYNPRGKLLGKIHTPETAANLCFGGGALDELFITACSTLFRIKLKIAGVR